MDRRQLLGMALLGWGALLGDARGNGINPPRPTGSAVVEAQCTDRTSGETAIVQRARATADNTDGGLRIATGSAAAQTVQLSRIGRIAFEAAKPRPDGFAGATLGILDPPYEGLGFVQVRIDGKPVRLTGFGAGLERVDVALESCRELALKTPVAGEARSEGAAKK